LRIILEPGTKFLLVIGAHVLACLAFLDLLCRTFNLREGLLFVHAPLVMAALGGALACARGMLRRIGDRRGAAYVAAIVPAGVVSTLFILYLANFPSHRWLGVSVDYRLAILWAQDWWKGKQLSASPDLLAGVLLSVGTVFALDLIIWAQALRGDRPRLLRPFGAIAGLVLLVGGSVALVQRLPVGETLNYLRDSDPILAFMRPGQAGIDARQLEIFERLRHDEPRRRAAYGRHTFDRKNVIVITIDSLRADHMQVYGYARPTTPFLSQLHDAGALRRVEFATSTCAESNCGILSTLFSKTLRHQVPEAFSLFTLLQDQGYDTHFVLSGNHHWMSLREMYGHELTTYFDGRDSARYAWSDDRVLLEGLDRIGNYARPSFFYFHLMAPHILGHKEERFRRFEPAVVKLDMNALWRGDYDRSQVINNYDNGIVQADDTIHSLFRVLDRKGYLRGSIVVILADHGESLADRADRMYGHVNWLYQETLSIPILIYDKSATTYRGLSFGTQLDVAPTIAARLGLPIPQTWEGVSLLGQAGPRRTMHQTKLAEPCFAIIDYAADRMLKYMRCTGGAREELYDLARDAAERRDLLQSTDPAVVAGFRSALDDWRSR
jgi:hypothetical protein